MKREIEYMAEMRLGMWELRFPDLCPSVMIDDVARELSHEIVNEKYCRMPFENGFFEKIERDNEFRRELKSLNYKIRRYLRTKSKVMADKLAGVESI